MRPTNNPGLVSRLRTDMRDQPPRPTTNACQGDPLPGSGRGPWAMGHDVMSSTGDEGIREALGGPLITADNEINKAVVHGASLPRTTALLVKLQADRMIFRNLKRIEASRTSQALHDAVAQRDQLVKDISGAKEALKSGPDQEAVSRSIASLSDQLSRHRDVVKALEEKAATIAAEVATLDQQISDGRLSVLHDLQTPEAALDPEETPQVNDDWLERFLDRMTTTTSRAAVVFAGLGGVLMHTASMLEDQRRDSRQELGLMSLALGCALGLSALATVAGRQVARMGGQPVAQ